MNKKARDSGLTLLQKTIIDKYFLLVFTLIISGCATIKDKSPFELCVLTYNIHHANPPSEQKGVIKLDAIAKVITDSKADIVALQELDSAAARSGNVYQLRELAQKLNMHYYFGKAIPHDGGSYGVGILSKYPLSEANTYPLPKLENVKSEDRVLALVKVHLSKNKTILFGSTHLDVNREENRVMQVEKILQLTAGKEPVIIAGDFNARPEANSIQKMQTVFKSAGVKNLPTIPNINPDRKIDFIFYAKPTDFILKNEGVITEASYESDHLPLWVDMEIK